MKEIWTVSSWNRIFKIANKMKKRCSTLLNHQINTNWKKKKTKPKKTRYHYTPTRMVNIKETVNRKYSWGYVARGTCVYSCCYSWWNHFGNWIDSLGLFTKAYVYTVTRNFTLRCTPRRNVYLCLEVKILRIFGVMQKQHQGGNRGADSVACGHSLWCTFVFCILLYVC